MIESEKPLMKKDQIALDEELAREIEAEGSSRRNSIEEEELKKCFELSKGEDVAINAVPLATKVPVIGFQIHRRGKPGPGEDFKRVLWGDLRVMFEPDVESKVWRSLQGYKRYPLTPITITNMLNKKLQADRWNEMVYQLLKLMIQKMNIKFRGKLLGLKSFLRLLLLSTADTKVNAAGLQLLEELLLLEGSRQITFSFRKDPDILGKNCKPCRTPWCIKGGPKA
ncbi:hypothetical protein Tco_1372468 [Tanacetum coccineum]